MGIKSRPTPAGGTYTITTITNDQVITWQERLDDPGRGDFKHVVKTPGATVSQERTDFGFQEFKTVTVVTDNGVNQVTHYNGDETGNVVTHIHYDL
jgi:hypothetical protein